MNQSKSAMAGRFRGFLPVIIDVETGGFNATTDALLELAAVTLYMDDRDHIQRKETLNFHVEPFSGANMEAASLKINGIDPYHPLRLAEPESEVLQKLFKVIRAEVKSNGCNRAVLVGHNAFFDLNFLNAALTRAAIKRNPFHPFTSFDTASLGGLAFGQTVLARAVEAAGFDWDPDEAHSAIYDAERTADLFCIIVNQWQTLGGWPPHDRR